MPELPEVETARRQLERAALGARIEDVRCAADRLVIEGGPRALARALRGRRILGTGRKGKHLWLELDRRPWPVFHFGMTGELAIVDAAGPRPRFWKLDLRLDRGIRIIYADARRLGRIRLREHPPEEPPISRLGFDPLLELPSSRRLATLLSGHRRPIKALLLDQGFSAGVGNWVADEVLYQARIDPRRPACRLGTEGARRLREALGRVVRRAVAVEADAGRFPRTWLFHHRWGRRSDARTARGETIRFITVGGRTTAFVPAVQK